MVFFFCQKKFRLRNITLFPTRSSPPHLSSHLLPHSSNPTLSRRVKTAIDEVHLAHDDLQGNLSLDLIISFTSLHNPPLSPIHLSLQPHPNPNHCQIWNVDDLITLYHLDRRLGSTTLPQLDLRRPLHGCNKGSR